MKYRFIQNHKHQYSLFKLCSVLRVSRTSYHSWIHRIPSKREQENYMLLEQIKKVHKESHRTFGSLRITVELKDKGYTFSRSRVARLMRRYNIPANKKEI